VQAWSPPAGMPHAAHRAPDHPAAERRSRRHHLQDLGCRSPRRRGVQSIAPSPARPMSRWGRIEAPGRSGGRHPGSYPDLVGYTQAALCAGAATTGRRWTRDGHSQLRQRGCVCFVAAREKLGCGRRPGEPALEGAEGFGPLAVASPSRRPVGRLHGLHPHRAFEHRRYVCGPGGQRPQASTSTPSRPARVAQAGSTVPNNCLQLTAAGMVG